MISYQAKEGLAFNYRMSGLCIHNNRILIHQFPKDDFWTLPGGRAEFLEDSKSTVAREFKEETGYQVKVGRPLWLVERFFDFKDKKWHELNFIYEVNFPSGSACLSQEEFWGYEDQDFKIRYKWFEFKELEKLTLYPRFLKEKLPHIPHQIERIVEWQENFKPPISSE